ncbi:MAG: rhomboid family intramembrane serine protease [Clostridiales bacterium]|nr:rhomboid family intramembrane serine protease [Clostridiales bacterium]
MGDILTALSMGLAEKGYNFIKTSGDNLISEETRELCFYKPAGAVVNYVIVINTLKENDPEGRFSFLTERILKSLRINAKAVVLGIAAGGPEAAEFAFRDDFDPLADIVRIRWAVDTENKNFICGKGSPDKFDGIETIIRSKDKKGLKTVSGIFRTEARKRTGFIRTRRVILTYGLIAVNIIVFIFMTLDGGSENTETLLKYGAIYAPYIRQGEYFRLFTYMFLHIGWLHIFSNMFGLYILGTRCEKYYGYLRFAAVYLFSGLGCSFLSFLFSGDSVSAGASGAVLGLMGSALVYTGINKIKMEGLDAYIFILISILNIGFGFVYPDVDNWGHIGGFAVGAAFGAAIGLADKMRVMENEDII